MEQINELKNTYDGGIHADIINGVLYQAELKKLQKHYGVRATLDSYEQALWDKEGAWARLDPCNELWLRVEAAKDIIGAEFAMKIHSLLAEGKTADEIITKLGSFERYLNKKLNPRKIAKFLWGTDIYIELKLSSTKWWFQY